MQCGRCAEADEPMCLNRVTATVACALIRSSGDYPPRELVEIVAGRPVVYGGPGTEMRKLIPKVLETDGCECESYARKMDLWGVAGCIEREGEIVEHIAAESDKQQWMSVVPMWSRKAVIRFLLTVAIEKAERNAS